MVYCFNLHVFIVNELNEFGMNQLIRNVEHSMESSHNKLTRVSELHYDWNNKSVETAHLANQAISL